MTTFSGAPLDVDAAKLSPFQFEGIPVHPDHGLVFESASSSPDLATEEELYFASLAISSPRAHGSFSSTASSAESPLSPRNWDFFSPAPSPSSTSDADLSPISSACSTPTRDSPLTKRDMNIPVPPSPSRLAESEKRRCANMERVHPYSRPSQSPSTTSGGSPMLRAYSTPVLTQRQMDERLHQRETTQVAMERQASSSAMGRSRTLGAGTVPGWVSSALSPKLGGGVGWSSSPMMSPRMSPTLGSTEMTASSSGLGFSMPGDHDVTASPFSFAFEQNWGAALPPRAPPTPARVPYPYNIHQQASPKFLRSHSAVDIPKSTYRRGSSPLFALTPIIPQSPPLPVESVASDNRPITRLHRGMSFS